MLYLLPNIIQIRTCHLFFIFWSAKQIKKWKLAKKKMQNGLVKFVWYQIVLQLWGRGRGGAEPEVLVQALHILPGLLSHAREQINKNMNQVLERSFVKSILVFWHFSQYITVYLYTTYVCDEHNWSYVTFYIYIPPSIFWPPLIFTFISELENYGCKMMVRKWMSEWKFQKVTYDQLCLK